MHEQARVLTIDKVDRQSHSSQTMCDNVAECLHVAAAAAAAATQMNSILFEQRRFIMTNEFLNQSTD